MKYSNYRKGLKNLREVLYLPDTKRKGQFSIFDFTKHNRQGESRRKFELVYSAKTNNVVAAVNSKGVVFVRRNSIYSGQLLNTDKHTVIASDNMRRFRNAIPNHVKVDFKIDMYLDEAFQKLVANKDVPQRVTLLSMRLGDDTDTIMRMVAERLAYKVVEEGQYLPNTARTLSERYGGDIEFQRYDVMERDERRVRAILTVRDYSEQIAEENRLNDIKRKVLKYLVENYSEFQATAMVNRSANPSMISVDFTSDSGERLRGTIEGRVVRQVHEGARELEDELRHVNLRPYNPDDTVEGASDRHQNLMNRMYEYAQNQYIQYQPGAIYRYNGTDVEHFYGGVDMAETAADWATARATTSASLTARDITEAAAQMSEPDTDMTMRPPQPILMDEPMEESQGW